MMPVFPTAYFGSIAYFEQLIQHPTVLIESREHFPKQTYRNRCDINGSDGILSLSIPVKKPNGSKTETGQVLLSDNENWRMRHWRSITSAYQSAPYFDYYGMEIEALIFEKTDSLLTLNQLITERILHWLDFDVTLLFTDTFVPVQPNDFRETLVEKNRFQEPLKAPYIQVFTGNENYRKSLSILDAILCEGPLARNLLINP